ncbi:MAG: polyphosphate kinase 2 family protein [Candidatus Aenigmarchaeota archaeon]|nr:polyphosphate kinase 2 family protein [Candidatus Aenigmarchaeota archaeon]
MRSHILDPGKPVRLSRGDPRDTDGVKEGDAREELEALREQIIALQNRLFFDGRRALLLVLQGMDTSGKDGTVRRVLSGVTPQGMQVHAFKVPTPEERAHDFLWRVHARVPGKGMLGVFIRSHYEDVLVPRVNGDLDDDQVEGRFDQINDFEATLVGTGTTVVKCFLHISRAEQAERLRERLREKPWKFNPGDLAVRGQWDAYLAAYEALLARCTTHHAPWTVVPADRKWFRDLVVARLLVQTLEGMDLRFPKPAFDPAAIVIR